MTDFKSVSDFSLCVNPVCKIFNATIQCLVRDHLLIDEQWSDDPKKFTYFLSKSESILDTLSSFEIGWRDEKLGVKVIRVALPGSQRKSLRSMKNARPKMRFKPCVLLA